MRALLRVLSRVLPIAAAALLSGAPAHAAPVAAALSATPSAARAGDDIVVNGDACAAGHTVTRVLQQTLPAYFVKGLPPFVPLDISAIGLVDGPTGVSFTVTATESRTSLYFRVDCSDGSSSQTATPVNVFPPVGEFWWVTDATSTIRVVPGQQFFLSARTLDCPAGAAATGVLEDSTGAVVIGPLATTVAADGLMEFSMTAPAAPPATGHWGVITCEGASGPITNRLPIAVTTGDSLPSMGAANAALAWLAAAMIAVGLILRVTARRRMR